jgi:hypothetical protein
MRKPRDVITSRWSVFILKRKAERFTQTVPGRNAEEAIERAIKEFGIPPQERFRVSVRREAWSQFPG